MNNLEKENLMVNGDPMILKRSVSIENWVVEASIAKKQKRSEMLPILLHLRDHSNCSVRDVSQTLFFDENSRLVIAERLLAISVEHGLARCENGKYSLTVVGERAIADGEIFIHERGLWKISLCRDQLLPHPVVNIKPFDDSAPESEVFSSDKDNLAKRTRNICQTPDWSNEFIGVQTLPLEGGGPLIVVDVERKGFRLPDDRLTLEWDLTQKTLVLLSQKMRSIQITAPVLSVQEAWNQLLTTSGIDSYWDSQRNSLGVLFKDMPDNKKSGMKITMELKKPQLPEYGQFERLNCANTKVHAINQADATSWAEWRFINLVDGFADRQKFSHWLDKAVAPFSEFCIALPDRTALAKDVWPVCEEKNRTNAWRIIAAEDWNI